MAKIQSGQPLDLFLASQMEAKIGQVVESLLDYESFQNEHLGTWYPLDGRSCIGTVFASATGMTTVPNALADGSFLRQAKLGRSLGSNQAEDFKSHTHIQNAHNHTQNAHNHNLLMAGGGSSGNAGTYFGSDSRWSAGSGSYTSGSHVQSSTPTNIASTAINQNTGGEETRPANIAVNFYIKVGY